MAHKYFLLDANVIVDFYLNLPPVYDVYEELCNRKKLSKCTIFIPNFCIAEAFSAFARKRYYEGGISEDTFKQTKRKFIEEVSRHYEYKRSQWYHHIELNRYHLLHAHLVYQPAWEFLRKEQAEGRHEKKRLSTFDLLVIAQGIEMANLYPYKDFSILTSDKLMIDVCNYLRNLKDIDKISFVQTGDDITGDAEGISPFKYPLVIDATKSEDFKQFCHK